MKNKLDNYIDDEIIEILNNSKSFREALHKLGYCSNGSSGYVSAKRIIRKRDITIPEYNYYGDGKSNPKYRLDEILIENSKYTSRTSLKKRLIKEGILKYECVKCKNSGEWEGESLSLQLEHKNGVNNDNRIENLEFLCPNCHSQSKTFSGKNKKSVKKNNIKINYCKCGAKIYKTSEMCIKCRNKFVAIKNRKIKNRPNKEILLNEVNELGYRKIGIKYNVSDNTIRNWLK